MKEKCETAYQRLKDRLATISDIRSAKSLLFWDQQTYMPKGGIASRAEQMATLSRLAHEMLVEAEAGRLLDSLGEPDPSTEEGALLRRARREYERATKLPAKLVAEITRTTALAEPAWVKAREEADWSLFAPHLEQIVPLKREAAEHLGYEDHPYDALLEGYEPGAKKAHLEKMFLELKEGIVPLARAVAEHKEYEEDRAAPLYGEFDEAEQEEFGKAVISAFGYDWGRGRQDRSVHPICINFGPGDVRVTTRFDEGWLAPALFGTMHEAGHALYEQGIPERLLGFPASRPASLGLHESQSRMWENQVGRSRAFTEFMLPHLKEHFPDELGMLTPEGFYRGANHPRRTLIRVTADELTYNLHVALRFEIELALFRDELVVADLPDAWDAGMEKHLGIRPESHDDGVLQDMHWSIGALGYFPTYTLGNLYAAAFFAEARADLPDLDEDLRAGDASALLAWLREKVHVHAYLRPAKEIGQEIIGGPLTAGPFLDYVGTKFKTLYD